MNLKVYGISMNLMEFDRDMIWIEWDYNYNENQMVIAGGPHVV